MEPRGGACLLHLVGLPDDQAHVTRDAIEVPWVLGLISTRSLTRPVAGIEELVADAKTESPAA